MDQVPRPGHGATDDHCGGFEAVDPWSQGLAECVESVAEGFLCGGVALPGARGYVTDVGEVLVPRRAGEAGVVGADAAPRDRVLQWPAVHRQAVGVSAGRDKGT